MMFSGHARKHRVAFWAVVVLLPVTPANASDFSGMIPFLIGMALIFFVAAIGPLWLVSCRIKSSPIRRIIFLIAAVLLLSGVWTEFNGAGSDDGFFKHTGRMIWFFWLATLVIYFVTQKMRKDDQVDPGEDKD